MDLDVLTEAIDRLSGVDPSAYCDGESIEALQRELARLDSFVTDATAAFDASGNWALDGAQNASMWLASRCRLPKTQARRVVRRGRELRHLPDCKRAWAAGDIAAAHVDVVTSLRRHPTEDALVRDESMLVDQASTLRFEAFTRAVAYWKQLADPDGADFDDEKRRDRRHVYLERSFDGVWLGGITLDPISGSIVGDELERIESEMFESDWAAARAELGREPVSSDLARTPGQRRADALVEMATRSRTAPSDGRPPRPLFSILVGYETLHGRICELASGTAVAPGLLMPWLDEAYFERVVFAPGRRVEVSATARLFSGATRRAVEVRDRECMHPYCDRPADASQIDHIVPYGAGGTTTQENGRVLCRFHNQLRNQRPPPDR
ncbi:MAG: DUF222 domain-containing protein [Acidimicrobiales bacterium]|jgi:hypothetical protein